MLNVGGWSWDMLNMFDTDVAKHIIRDPDHTLRVHLCMPSWGRLTTIWVTRLTVMRDHEKAVKAQFNRKINKTCGFTKQVRG
jgi:hypothetical protein